MLDSVYNILLLAHPSTCANAPSPGIQRQHPKTIFLGLHLVLSRQNA